MSLPDDDPVYTLKKVMEDLDFSGLLANCSDKGRTGYNRVMMYAVITYTNMRGIRSIDRIVDLCERDIAFIWLTQGRKPKRDAFYEFKSKKLTSDKVYKEFMLFAIGRNINKYHRFLHVKLKKFEGKPQEKTA